MTITGDRGGRAPAPDPAELAWAPWDPSSVDHASLRWDHGGYVAEGVVASAGAHFAVRLDADHVVRQLLLFRYEDDPDLWLATDGHGRWGEVNGAERGDLWGCTAVAVAGAPWTHCLPVHALARPTLPARAVTVDVAVVDLDTLGITVVAHTYAPTGERRWRVAAPSIGFVLDADVDAAGLLLDASGHFRRSSWAPGSP